MVFIICETVYAIHGIMVAERRRMLVVLFVLVERELIMVHCFSYKLQLSFINTLLHQTHCVLNLRKRYLSISEDKGRYNPLIEIEVELHLLFDFILFSLCQQHVQNSLVEIDVFGLFSNCVQHFLFLACLVLVTIL